MEKDTIKCKDGYRLVYVQVDTPRENSVPSNTAVSSSKLEFDTDFDNSMSAVPVLPSASKKANVSAGCSSTILSENMSSLEQQTDDTEDEEDPARWNLSEIYQSLYKRLTEDHGDMTHEEVAALANKLSRLVLSECRKGNMMKRTPDGGWDLHMEPILAKVSSFLKF